jgi:hypothetical protein
LQRRLQNCEFWITRRVCSQSIGLRDQPYETAVLDRRSGFEIVFGRFLIINRPGRYEFGLRLIGIEDGTCS